jgi:putative peptidoglycan lipid II flippase
VPRTLARDSRTLAIGTIASRISGFVRNTLLVAILGIGGVGQAFGVSNTLPNTLYELLLGGVLTSTLVPLLVQARGENRDEEYAQRLLTLIVLGLTGLTAIAVLAAPGLIRLYSASTDPDEIGLAVAWARFFLPQIVFYGIFAMTGAVLNSRGRFGAPVWAPVLNNVVVIITLALFTLVPGPGDPTPLTLSTAQLAVLGTGTTLGVVAMTSALLPALRASGFHWRLRLDVRGMGLRRIARIARWTGLYVVSTQLSFLVLTRLASRVEQVPQYVGALMVWQLPHAVIAVSVITALLPRLARHGVNGRLDLLRRDLDRALQLTVLLLLPAALSLVVLGRQVAEVIYAHGVTSFADAERIGTVLSVLAVGLVPFSCYQLQLRAFYALNDTRTPALIQALVSTVVIGFDLIASAVLSGPNRVFGLAAGLVVANAVGAVVTAVRLRRRLRAGGLGTEADGLGTDADGQVTGADGLASEAEDLATETVPETVPGMVAEAVANVPSAIEPLPLTATLVRALAAGAVGSVVALAVAGLLGSVTAASWVGAALMLAPASLVGLIGYVGVLVLLGVNEARWAVGLGVNRVRGLRTRSRR